MNTHDGIGVDLGIKDFATCSHHETFQKHQSNTKSKENRKNFKTSTTKTKSQL